MTDREKLIEQAIAHFKYGVSHDIFREPVTTYAKIAIEALETLRPTGRWVMKETMIRSPYAKNAYCSECLEETGYSHNYCPNCGAKMMEG